MADNRHHIGNCFKKCEQSLRAGLQWLIPVDFNDLGEAYAGFLPAVFLSWREGAGWVTLTGSDPGNESSRPWSSARSRRRWVSSLGLFSSRAGFCFGLSMGLLPAARHAPQWELTPCAASRSAPPPSRGPGGADPGLMARPPRRPK